MLQQDRNKAKKNTNDPIAIRRSGKSSSSCYVAYQPDLRPNVDANRFLGSLARNPERGPPYQGSGISVNPDRWLKNLGVEYQDVIFELDGEGFERWNELSEKYVNAVMAGRSTAVLSLMRLPKNGLLKWKRIDINIPLIRMLAVSPLQSIRLDPEDVEAGAWRWLDFNGDGQKDLVITGPGYSNIGPLKVYDGKTGCPQAMKQSIEGSLANSKLYVNQAKNIRLLSMKGPPRKRQGLTQLYEINTQKLISIKTSNFQATHVYDLDEDGQFDIYGYVQDRYKKRYYSGYSGADASKIFEGQKGELYERFHRPEHALRAEPDFGAVPRRSFWVKGRGQQAMLLLNKLGGLRSKDERLRFAPHDWNNTQKNVLIGEDANNWDLHDPSVQVVSPVIANVQLLDTNNNGQWEVVGLRKGYFLRLETKFDVLKTPDTVPQKKPETKPQDDIPEILKSGPKSNPSKPKTKRRKRRRGR